MRMLSLIGVLTALCGLAETASAQRYRDTTGDAINPGKAINETATNTEIQLGVEQGITQGTHQTPNGVPVQQGNHWRYRFQNSQWWYYQTNKQWVVWNGKSWVQPAAATSKAGNQPRQHQSGYRGTQGMNQQPARQAAPAAQSQPAQPAAAKPAMTSPAKSTPINSPTATKETAKPIEKQPKPGTAARNTTTPAGSEQ